MNITGTLGLGTAFTVNVGSVTAEQIALSPNQSPNGVTVEAEMEEHISMFLSLVELAFAAPEPVRRNFVGIIKANIGRAAHELQDAIEVVAQVMKQRAVAGN